MGPFGFFKLHVLLQHFGNDRVHLNELRIQRFDFLFCLDIGDNISVTAKLQHTSQFMRQKSADHV